MVTKGIIKTIDYNGNTCTVRVPFFETANNDEIVSEAAVSNTPGSYNGYKVGDVVWVAFEDGSMDHPVVIGKLYLGVESEKADPRGTLNVVDSRVSNSAEIPFDTKLGSNPADNVANTNVPFSSLDQVANSLSTAEVNIAQNDRDYGNRFKLVGEEINYEASRKLDHTGESEAFGWELRPEHWKVYKKTTANGATTTKDILTVNDDGLTVTGTVQADDGHIGKFLIGATHTCPVKDAEGNTTSTVQASGIFSENFIEKFEDEATKRGVYVGTDGIKVGSNFSVDTSGVVTATELVLKPENVYLEEEETDPETGRPRRRTLKKRIEDGDTATDTLMEVLENNLGAGITSTKMTSDFIVAPYLGVKGAHITDALVVGDKDTPKLAIDITNPAVKIGGFDVSTSGISSTDFGSTYASAGSKDSGIYVGTDGIKLGKTFSVSSSGTVVATDLIITGNKSIETALSDTQTAAESTAKGYADTAEGNAKTAAQGYANTAEANAKSDAETKLEAALSSNSGHTTLGDTWLSTTDVYAKNLTVKKADITDKLEVKSGNNTILYASTSDPDNVKVGGWTLGNNSLRAVSSYQENEGGTSSTSTHAFLSSSNAGIEATVNGSKQAWALKVGSYFGVTPSGLLDINSAKIGDWSLSDDGLISKQLEVKKTGLKLWDSSQIEHIALAVDNSYSKSWLTADTDEFRITTSAENNGFKFTKASSGYVNVNVTLKVSGETLTATLSLGSGHTVSPVPDKLPSTLTIEGIKVGKQPWIGYYNEKTTSITFSAGTTIAGGSTSKNVGMNCDTVWGAGVGFVDDRSSITVNRNVYSPATGKGINYSYTDLLPDGTSGTYSLGDSTHHWKQIYIDGVNGASATSTDSDRKLKNTIEYDISKYDAVFDNLKPVSYKYNNSNSGRTHLGLIAQDVQEAIQQAGLTDKDYSIVTIDGPGFDIAQGIVVDEAETTYRIRYPQLHALEIRQIQLLKHEIKRLKAEIEELKSKKS